MKLLCLCLVGLSMLKQLGELSFLIINCQLKMAHPVMAFWLMWAVELAIIINIFTILGYLYFIYIRKRQWRFYYSSDKNPLW